MIAERDRRAVDCRATRSKLFRDLFGRSETLFMAVYWQLAHLIELDVEYLRGGADQWRKRFPHVGPRGGLRHPGAR